MYTVCVRICACLYYLRITAVAPIELGGGGERMSSATEAVVATTPVTEAPTLTNYVSDAKTFSLVNARCAVA